MNFNISQIAHLDPILIESTNNYVIYQIILDNQIEYYGYSSKWDEIGIEDNLKDLKGWLIELNQTKFICANDIYNSKVIKSETDISWLIKTINLGHKEQFTNQTVAQVIIKYHVTATGITVSSVWFINNPVMVIIKHYKPYIVVTQENEYLKMIVYLNTLRKEPEIEFPIIKGDKPLKELSVIGNYFTEELLIEATNEH